MSDDGFELYGTVDERPAWGRHRGLLIGAAGVLLATGIGGFAAGWASRGTPAAPTSVASQGGTEGPSVLGGETAASPTTVGISVGVGTASALPVGFVGGAPIGQEATSLGRWTTPDGIAVRAYRNSFARSVAQPAPCEPSGFLIVEVSDAEAVSQAEVPLFSDAGRKTEVMAISDWGLVEGAPAAWVVVSAGPGVGKVSASFDGGDTDVVTPVDGLAVLASRLKAVPAGGSLGTVVASGGGRTTTLPLMGPSESMVTPPSCLAGPPTTVPSLPPAGTPPSDPVAARAAVTKAIGIVMGGIPAPDPFEYVQGATASVRAAQKTAQDNNPTAHTSTVVQQIVFTSPTTGAVRYELLDNGSQVLDPVSDVVLDAGIWKVTTASACAAYALGGGHC